MTKEILSNAVKNIEVALDSYVGTKKDHFQLQNDLNLIKAFIEIQLTPPIQEEKSE